MSTQDSPIVTLARDLADALGTDWSAIPSTTNPYFCHLVGPDACMSLREPHPYGPREGTTVRISTALPTSIPDELRTNVGSGVEHATINVSVTRKTAAIARDIERRLLPDARTVHTAAIARLAQLRSATTARHRLRDQLTKRMPGAHVGAERVDARETTLTSGVAGESVDGVWEINHDGTRVKATLSGLSPDQARRIAKLLYPNRPAA
jgi:hypothetical protein